jgi:lysophospholipase L1-like esterase
VSAIASPSSEPSTAITPFTLVALGDSIPYNSSDDCPGCTGFVDSYASALETALGVSVKVVNQSRHDGARTSDILRQVRSDESLREQLGTADIAVISVAFNDQPPFADSHRGCPPATDGSASDADYVQAAAVTSHACIDSVVPLIRDGVAQVFAGIREVAPQAAIGVLTAYDTWRGWDYLDQFDEPTRSAVLDAETYWFKTWNAALCDEAAVIDAVCVDAYRAFNGADGTEPAGDYLSGDYTHPSQKGNDVIRDLLIEAALPARRPS